MSKNPHGLFERTCPVCGKTFVPAPHHVYEESNMLFCKWTCLTKYRREKEKATKDRALDSRHYTADEKRQAVRLMVNEKKSQHEVSRILHIPQYTLGRWLAAYKGGEIDI